MTVILEQTNVDKAAAPRPVMYVRILLLEIILPSRVESVLEVRPVTELSAETVKQEASLDLSGTPLSVQ